MQRTTVLAGVLITAGIVGAAAQSAEKKMHACSLLTSAEIGAAVGGTVGRLKAKGWTEEKKDFSNGTCALMTPPPSEKSMPESTGCVAESKGMGISVGFSGRSSVPLDNVKVLLVKAIGRLP